MARLLENEWDWFGDENTWDQQWTQAGRLPEFPQPLSKEWFRANPQWATDRLMQWRNASNET